MWNRIIFPDGSSLDINGMPGADQGGYTGFYDEANKHHGRMFGSALLLSLFSARIELSRPQQRSVSTTLIHPGWVFGLGFQRTGPDLRLRIETVLNSMIRTGQAADDDGHVTLWS